MALYENIFIVRQDVSSAQVDAITDGFEEIVTGLGGSVAKREYWGLRTLAYRIKKNKKGHYVLLDIDAPTEAVNELARQMRLHEDVLRELTIRLDSFPETPSPIMLTKGDRDRDRASRETTQPNAAAVAAPDSESASSGKDTAEKKADVDKVEAIATTEGQKAAAESGDADTADAEPEKPKRSPVTKTKTKKAKTTKKDAAADDPAAEASDANAKTDAKPKRAAAQKSAKAKEPAE
jgi:small subunit ribosomal protein S6